MKKLTLALIIVALLVLAGGAVWYFKMNGARDKVAGVATTTPTSTPALATTTTSNGTKPSTKPTTEEPVVLSFPDNHLDTSDWQTYRNEEFGFEVKYPKTWKASEYKNENFTNDRDARDHGMYVSVGGVYFGDPDDTSFSGLEIRIFQQSLRGIIDNPTPLLGSPANDGIVFRRVRVGETEGVQQVQLAYEDRPWEETGNYIFGSSERSYLVVDTAGDEQSLLIAQKILLSFKLVK